MSVPQQRKLQIGTETVWNTAVAPTVQLAGNLDVACPPSMLYEIQRQMRGVVSPGRDAIVIAHRAEGITANGVMTYEQLPYWLDMADEATPAGADPYTYDYNAWTLAAATPRKQTLVFGVGDGIWGLTSAALAGFTITWKWGETAKISYQLMGGQVAADTFASLTEPTDAATTEVLGSHATAYIDAFDGTIGSTAMTKCLNGEINVVIPLQFLMYTGSIYPAGVFASDAWQITGRLTVQQDATSAGYVAAAIGAVTKKLLRTDFNNTLSTTAERGYLIDMPVTLKIDDLMTDDDNLVTSDLTFESIEEGDLTYAGSGEVDGYYKSQVISNLSTLY